MRELDQGNVVLAPDVYKSGKRPFAIVSDSDYPFYPHGYLGVPITTQDRPHTVQIHEYDIVEVNESLHVDPSYINPWSPAQVNDIDKELVVLSDNFINTILERVGEAMGIV
jgi:hypothetical protein